MDRLTTVSMDHSRIAESMIFFKKFLEVIMHDASPSYIEDIQDFSNQYIVQHFRFEEKRIFPLIFREGRKEEKRLVQKLQAEHEQILDTLDEFHQSISCYGPQPSREEIKKTIQLIEPVTSMVLLHTRKEDEQLYPAVKELLSGQLAS